MNSKPILTDERLSKMIADSNEPDIVERLRQMGTHYGGSGAAVADEAAAEIERLREEYDLMATSLLCAEKQLERLREEATKEVQRGD